MIYFPTNWGAKEPQNLPNHRVANYLLLGDDISSGGWMMSSPFDVSLEKHPKRLAELPSLKMIRMSPDFGFSKSILDSTD